MIGQKTLSYNSCERFYRIRDALADYAYERLDISAELYISKGKKFSDDNVYNEDTLSKTLNVLWESPSVLEDFIDENPAGLLNEDLAVVRDWRVALKGMFIVFSDKGRMLFMRGKELFDVVGLYDSLETLIPEEKLPMMVETTLLPFENKIVHYGFMSYMPVSMGKGMLDMIDSEIEEALRDPHVITGGYRFMQTALEIQENEQKAREEQREHEIELEKAANKQMEGSHKGVLSGLPEQEREEAINAYMHDNLGNDLLEPMIKILQDHSIRGEVTRNYLELLVYEDEGRLQRVAEILGLDVSESDSKAGLIRELAPVLGTNPFLSELTLRAGLSIIQFESFRKLYEAGGVLEFPESEITSLKDLPPEVHFMCYTFFSKGSSERDNKYTFVIPEDIMDLLGTLDWDGIKEQIISYQAAADIAEAIADLRGIVKVDDAFEEFRRFYPESLSIEQFEDAVMGAIRDESISCSWLDADDDNSYILNYEIAGYYSSLFSDGDEEEEYDDAFLEGPFEALSFITDQQSGKRARPLERGMLSSIGLFDWKCARPAVRALRNYLDENVPDSQNDYYFADAVIEELIDTMTCGGLIGSESVNQWLKILTDHDYFPNEAHMTRMIRLLMNMYNSLPSWLNNGWAPNELADAMSGRKTFYDENGIRIKVGRNDPCPCGSGKKYKHCCGRNANN